MKQLIFSITKDDFHIDWFSGTGAGGQHRNKHMNCVRLKHKESGIVTTGQSHKSRSQNMREAFKKIAKLLVDYYVPKVEKERGNLQEQQTRTYNECENYVKDHLTGEKFSYKHTIGKGDLGTIIESRIKKSL